MGISTLQIFRQGLNSILDQQSGIQRTQQQVSSGKKILDPSDDPAGTTRVMSLSDTENITQQYQSNIINLRNRLEAEEAVLSAGGDVMQRINELAVEGLNDALSANDRQSIAKEVRQLTDEMVGLANRKDGSGEYLFAGTRTRTKPFEADNAGGFVYQGDQGQRQIRVAPDRLIAAGNTGFDVFMKIPDGNGGYSSAFSTLYQLASDLEADNPNQDTIGKVNLVIDHFLTQRSDVGARQNALDSQEKTNDVLVLQLRQTRSDIEDVDIVEAAARLSQQTLSFQAAQQAFVRVQGLSLFNFL